MQKTWLTAVAVGTIGITGAFATPANAAVIAYDFSGTNGTQPAGWAHATPISNGPGTRSITPLVLNGGGRYVHLGSSSGDAQMVEVGGFQIADREAATGFAVTTQFSHPAVTFGGGSGGYNLSSGIRFLASGATVESEAAATFYQLVVSRDNGGGWDLTLSERAGGATSVLSFVEMDQGTLLSPFNTSTAAYTLSVTGTYIAGNLKLDYSLTNGSVTRSGSFTDSTPRSGDYFGVRSRWRTFAGNSGSGFTTSFDSYGVTYTQVPEPTSLMALAGLAGLMRRRRR